MTRSSLSPIYACEISRSDNYIESLSLRRTAALPGHAELVITSQLLTAKDPKQSRVLHRSIVPVSALSNLRETLGELLRDGSTEPRPMQ